ncbi:unnamed protein product [Pleuronectes platessa]|uniref:Uncharacterized protein n=1 Tax=Pleuronectes platessa TaxID=8262 RepID=A0A9N7V8J4_PLEPL|nr:unnamed protein product [Pleuronectes platessa]
MRCGRVRVPVKQLSQELILTETILRRLQDIFVVVAVSELRAKKLRPHTEGGFAKQGLFAELLPPDKVKLLQTHPQQSPASPKALPHQSAPQLVPLPAGQSSSLAHSSAVFGSLPASRPSLSPLNLLRLPGPSSPQ